MKRNGRGRASSCSKGRRRFQGDLQLGGAEGPHVGYLVGELAGRGVGGWPAPPENWPPRPGVKRFAVGEGHRRAG